MVSLARIPGLGASAPQIFGTTGTAMALTGGTLALLAPSLALAGPIGAIAGGVVALLGAIGIGSGCGETCIAATEYANQSAQLMQQNMQQYFSIPAPRPKSAQQGALANFDALWAGLTSPQACGNPALGDPGRRCISERQRGGKYDDFKYNRDPIANDPDVYDDGEAGSVISSLGQIPPMVLLGGALLLIAAGAAD